MTDIKNYKNAQYKNKLSYDEYNNIVSTAVVGIIRLYDDGVYGSNEYMTDVAIVKTCTDIDLGDDIGVDEKYTFFTETDVLERIARAIGEETYGRILNDIDLGVRYRSSTNPETKHLLAELGNLAHNLSNISEDSIKDITDLFKFTDSAGEPDADK